MLKKLNQAISQDNIEEVIKIIENGVELKPKDEYWQSPLFEAARTGNIDIAKTLLAEGVDPNYQDYAGMTALYFAVYGRDAAMVRLLLDNGVKIDVRDGYEDETPLCVAVNSNNFEIIELLLNSGSDPHQDLITRFRDIAASINNTELRELIYKARGLTDDEFILYEAVRSGDVRKLSTFSEQVINSMICPCYNQTLLHIAASHGHLEIVKNLITLNFEINAKDSRGYTPLIEALIGNYDRLVEYLIHQGADVNLISNKYSTLYWAIFNDMENVVKLILKSNLDSQILQKEFPQAIRKANIEIVKAFLDAGVDTTILDSQGYTPLINAIQGGNCDLVKKMIEIGLDINECDDEGWHPLLHATENSEMAKLLYEFDADPWIKNNKNMSVFHGACMNGLVWLVKDLILKKPDVVNEKSKDGWSPLHYAAWHGRVEIAKILIDKNANIDITDNSGETPLEIAIGKEHNELVDFLNDYHKG
ncbi:ankyrin repeat domain-containing protein [Aquimarina megaterium]|uniref:ankyrin repeat domain-containing protein n=1 Tax=Aquimarina megaterium TaxID=1443666 RepID=UPI000470D550|nr:ankyrin repeat domain-containing protein [Aquimarina megaterium]